MAAVIATLSALTSCNGNGSTSSANKFEVDSIAFERSLPITSAPDDKLPAGNVATFSVNIDFPKSATGSYATVSESIKRWISSTLNPEQTVPVTNRSAIDMAANTFFNTCEKDQMPMEQLHNIKFAYEDENYITYETYLYIYSGGAHGIYTIEGATFRKSDGTMVTKYDFEQTDELRHLITARIKDNIGANVDERFEDMLLDAGERDDDGKILLPMPKTDPWLTSDGWVFTYQTYEIAPYSLGAPACTIKQDELKMTR